VKAMHNWLKLKEKIVWFGSAIKEHPSRTNNQAGKQKVFPTF
jgi:hypothetical protein